MALLTVFNKGSSNGLIALIPRGGHWAPSSTVGDNALVNHFILTTNYIFYINIHSFLIFYILIQIIEKNKTTKNQQKVYKKNYTN